MPGMNLIAAFPASAAEGVAPVADRVLGFSVAGRNVRGRIVRLDAALNAVLAAHDYPPPLGDAAGGGAGPDRAARRDVPRRRPDDSPGAGEGRRGRPARLRLPRRAVARLSAARCRAGGDRPRGGVRRRAPCNHPRPGRRQRTLPGDRPARGRVARRGGRAVLLPVRAAADAAQDRGPLGRGAGLGRRRAARPAPRPRRDRRRAIVRRRYAPRLEPRPRPRRDDVPTPS